MARLMKFVLSNGNLAGAGAATLVVLLYLAGVVHAYWFGLAVLAYGIGFLVVPQPKVAELLPEGTSTQESVAWLRTEVLPALPEEARRVLRQILDIVDELMPRLKEMEAVGAIQAQSRATLKMTVTRYLPDVVTGYLKLPPVYAASARVAEGKTPNQLLLEQLTLLQAHVEEIRSGVLSEDVDALLTNGRFLQQKFAKAFTVN